jgi:hypothetical protein
MLVACFYQLIITTNIFMTDHRPPGGRVIKQKSEVDKKLLEPKISVRSLIVGPSRRETRLA